MILIKFHTSDKPYSGLYAWRLAERDGYGLYAHLNNPRDMLEAYGGALAAAAAGYSVDGLDFETLAERVGEELLTFSGEITDEDAGAVERLNDKSRLIALNEMSFDWSAEELKSPGKTIGALLSKVSPEDKLLRWIAAGGYDDICGILAEADSYSPAESVSDCGCSSAAPAGDGCSALDKYRQFMNGKVTEAFSSIDYLHALFTISFEGFEIPNAELIDAVSSLIETASLSSLDGCGCASAPMNDAKLAKNIRSALSLIGTDDECRRKAYITYWCGELAKSLI